MTTAVTGPSATPNPGPAEDGISTQDAARGPAGHPPADARTVTADARTVTAGARIGYGLGALVTGACTTLPGLLLLPYLTDTLGVAAAAAGLVVLLPKVWAVLLAPLAGRVSDRTHGPAGGAGRRPYILFGGLGTAAGFGLMFAGAGGSHGTPAVVLTAAGFLLTATTCAFFQAAYAALPAELAERPRDRMRLVGGRVAGIALAAVCSGAAAPAIVAAGGGGIVGHRWAGLFGAAVIALGTLGTLGVVAGTARASGRAARAATGKTGAEKSGSLASPEAGRVAGPGTATEATDPPAVREATAGHPATATEATQATQATNKADMSGPKPPVRPTARAVLAENRNQRLPETGRMGASTTRLVRRLWTWLGGDRLPRPPRQTVPNRPFQGLLRCTVTQVAATGCLLAGAPYYARHVLHSEALIGALVAAFVLPNLCTTGPWTRFGARHGGRSGLAASSALFAAGCLLLFVTPGLPGAPAAWTVCVMLLAGVGHAGQLLFLYAMLAECTARDPGRAGSLSGMFSAGETAGLAVGPFLFALVLEVSGYASSATGRAAEQSGSAEWGVLAGFALLPALAVLGGLLWLRGHGTGTTPHDAAATPPAVTPATPEAATPAAATPATEDVTENVTENVTEDVTEGVTENVTTAGRAARVHP